MAAGCVQQVAVTWASLRLEEEALESLGGLYKSSPCATQIFQERMHGNAVIV